MPKPSVTNSQQLLEIEEIREGLIILKSGDLRAVIMVSGINFALKSEEEQEALTYAFQNFLNSLDFSIQIVIQSRNINIKDYLEGLEELETHEQNELLRLQIIEYQDFIKSFVSLQNIMTKNFFVVIPFGVKGAKQGLTETIKATFKSQETTKISQEKFIQFKDQLMQRVEYIVTGLHRMELNTRILNTEELIELYWYLYNPGEGEKPYIPEQIEGATMGHLYGITA